MDIKKLRVLLINNAGVSLLTVPEMQERVRKSASRLNPSFDVFEEQCGISSDYDKEDPHTDPEDYGRRHIEPHDIGTRWHHPESTGTIIMVFNPSFDHELAKALGAVQLTFQDRLKQLAGIK